MKQWIFIIACLIAGYTLFVQKYWIPVKLEKEQLADSIQEQEHLVKTLALELEELRRRLISTQMNLAAQSQDRDREMRSLGGSLDKGIKSNQSNEVASLSGAVRNAQARYLDELTKLQELKAELQRRETEERLAKERREKKQD